MFASDPIPLCSYLLESKIPEIKEEKTVKKNVKFSIA